MPHPAKKIRFSVDQQIIIMNKNELESIILNRIVIM